MTGTWMRTAWRTAAAGAAAVVLVAVGAPAPGPAGAGGGEWMYPVRDRYEPGQDVMMVGYTQTAQPTGAGTGPYYAWLRVGPAAEARAEAADGVYVDPTDIRLTPVVVEDTPVEGYHGRRASISFTLPRDLPPGHYHVILCNDPCTEAPGYLLPEELSVGVPPEYRIVRDWPATEPAIRWLDDDALLYSPYGQTVTAAEFRAGSFPQQTAPPPGPPTAPPTTVPATTAPPDAAADDSESTTSEPADDGWMPLGTWLAGLVALALAGGALVARGRRARRTDAAAPEPRAILAEQGGAGEPGGDADGADDRALVRT